MAMTSTLAYYNTVTDMTMSLGHKSVRQIYVGQMSVYQMSVRQITVMSVDEMSSLMSVG